MKTKIVKIKGDWQEVVNDCRATVGKGELGKDPSVAFKKSIMISEHSPIRDIQVKWIWAGIKSWIATHWSRHKWECFIKTQRPDRTGVERGGPDTPVTFTGDANVQHLIDTMRKRLCMMASTETREYAKDLKRTLREIEPEISDVLVPNCVYRCGCPECDGCGFFEALEAVDADIKCTDIQKRYDAYNKFFYKE
jgi:hypothetical protein